SSRRCWATALLITVSCLPSVIVGYQDYQNSINQHATKSEHAPILQISSREGYVPETAVVGTTVRVSPNPQAESLQILVSDEDLIQAREVDTVPIRSSEPVTITIHVIDVNDNPPQFEQPIYTVNVSTFGDERPVVKVLATDPDSGAFGQISYRILQVTNGAEGRFRYDDPTNTLYVNGDLTPGERYQVVIEATDGGGKSSQAIVVVLATHSVFSLGKLGSIARNGDVRAQSCCISHYSNSGYEC
ncbi:cadherin domain protein, partial [Ostertagia ostertagi]